MFAIDSIYRWLKKAISKLTGHKPKEILWTGTHESVIINKDWGKHLRDARYTIHEYSIDTQSFNPADTDRD